jgi:hypothetical protein
VSIAFLRWMAGRALVQTGRPREALAVLERVEGAGPYPHVRAGLLRWRANAHEALGDRAKAGELRDQLATVRDVPAAAEFGALDAALTSDVTHEGALEAIVDRIIAIGPQGIHGLLGPASARVRAERIANEYPY